MQKIIPLFNQLQEILQKNNLNNTIQLPQIVAVGAQSTGKSSVLESILGKDLLPRGTGIVTRRPIVLQLNNVPPNSEEYIEFGHKHGERFTNWHLARTELEQEMDRGAGDNKGISPDAIIVRMYSPHVVTLNIVDLPGITKIPVGDQPADIEQRVYDMIMTYIKNPNSIILAVTPANVDLANSDSLKLARDVDPEGNRTIGVITKLDLMEEDTHCLEALEGKLYKLKLGYVGVVSRSQKDLDNKKSVHDAVEDEKSFFRKHKVYGKFHEKLGIDFLTKELSRNFLSSIKRTLPSIKESLQKLVQESDTEMARNGDFELDLSSKEAKSQILLSIVSRFADTYSDIVGGNYVQATTKELFGGARINYILYDVFNKAIEDMDPFLTLTDEVIRVAIRNANGLDPAIFLPESAFENLVIQQIIRLERPVNECLFLIYEELRKVIHLVDIPGVSRFRMLEIEIDRVLEDMLKKNYHVTKEMIKNLLEIEMGYINTNHPDFIGGIDMLIEMADSQKEEGEGEQAVPNNFEDLRNMMLEKMQNTLEKKEEKKELEIKEIDLEEMTKEQREIQSSDNIPKPKPERGNESIEESMKIYNNIDFEKSVNRNFDKQTNHDQNSASMINTNIKNMSYERSKGSMHNKFQNPAFFRVQLPEVAHKMRLEEEPTQREALEVDMIKKLVISYFNVVKKNINDSIIKTIITFMVNKLKTGCEKELVTRLYKEELYDKLLVEDEQTMIDRKSRKEKAAYLKKCSNLVTEMDSKI